VPKVCQQPIGNIDGRCSEATQCDVALDVAMEGAAREKLWAARKALSPAMRAIKAALLNTPREPRHGALCSLQG